MKPCPIPRFSFASTRFAVAGVLTAALTSGVFAQNINLQDVFRGQAPMMSGGVVAPRPQPAAAGSVPQGLQNPGMEWPNGPVRKRVVCKYPEGTAVGRLAETAQRLPDPTQRLPDPTQRLPDPTQRLGGEVIELYDPNDFELFVKATTGRELCRFGHQATYDVASFFEPPPLSMVPDDYVLGPGDEVFIRLWGSVEQDVALVLDRSGQVVIPRVGPVKLGGVKFGQASDVVRLATRKLFSDFNASVSLGKLRGIRVYVTGYADRPGAYNVSNLSSLSAVLMASGGPSKAGSFRHISLRRGGQVVSEFDLYDLLLKGDKSKDRLLLSEDVIHIGPIAAQVAILGGVNKPAVFEIKSGEGLQDLIGMAGGLVPGADKTSIHRLEIEDRAQGFKALSSGQLSRQPLKNGDVYISKNDSRFVAPDDKSNRRVLISGQVRNPGEYFLPPAATLRDAITAAGGLVPGAYPYGLQLLRPSVLLQQRATLDRVLRELDRDVVASSTITPLNAEEARLLQVRADLSRTLVERLQSFRPDGRISLPISPHSSQIPLIELEDGDRVEVPLIPAHVGVYGSVVNAGTFMFRADGRLGDYLAFAGGGTKGAYLDGTFVVRANGQAQKVKDSGAGVLGVSFGGVRDIPIFPGDNVVVPEDMNKTTAYRELGYWATLLYQLGLGAAALKVLSN